VTKNSNILSHSFAFSGVSVREKGDNATKSMYFPMRTHYSVDRGGHNKNASEDKNILLRFGSDETYAFTTALLWLGPERS